MSELPDTISPCFDHWRQACDRVDDWKWQVRNTVTTEQDLQRVLVLSDQEREGIELARCRGFPLLITPHYLSLCDPLDSNCPIRRQCIPRVEEADESPGDMRDPLGEEAHEKAPGLIQRYPDRVLLLVTDRCSIHCRFCTRSRLIGRGRGARSDDDLQEALAFIRRNPQIKEVIISGGEPLLMDLSRLGTLLQKLASLPSVLYVRVATRLLATLPQRITASVCQTLRRHPSTWLMTHFNHPRELTSQALGAARLLADSGIPLMNQTVLLRGVNDDAPTLQELFRGLVRARVRPYYLLQADPVRGTGHLRTSIAAGIDIMQRLQGRLSGIALPRLMVDTPGGKGKVPVGPDYMVQYKQGGPVEPARATLRTFGGELVDYIDPIARR